MNAFFDDPPNCSGCSLMAERATTDAVVAILSECAAMASLCDVAAPSSVKQFILELRRSNDICSTTGSCMCWGRPWGRRRRRGTRHPTGGSDASGGGDRRDGDAGAGSTRPPAIPDPRRRRSVPDPPQYPTRASRGAVLAHPGGRGRQRLAGPLAAGTSRCAWDGYFHSSGNVRLGGFDMHGRNYLQ